MEGFQLKKSMKVFLSFLMSICLVATSALMLSGCHGHIAGEKCIEESFISEGDFQFYYAEKYDCYAVVGLTEKGKKKDTALVVPAYFRGKLVELTSYSEKTHGWVFSSYRRYTCSQILANTIFYPYTVTDYVSTQIFDDGIEGKIFFANCSDYRDAIFQAYSSHAQYFVTSKAYEKIMEDKEEIESKELEGINLADTAFLFNYESAPNDGYFFINDFERGGKIENTPYEPMREGYAFAGWYKEADCINAWDFERDTLPLPEYDEDGDLIFVETRLYAKWDKV